MLTKNQFCNDWNNVIKQIDKDFLIELDTYVLGYRYKLHVDHFPIYVNSKAVKVK